MEKSSEGLIEFTKLPGSKVKTEESGDERRTKQVNSSFIPREIVGTMGIMRIFFTMQLLLSRP